MSLTGRDSGGRCRITDQGVPLTVNPWHWSARRQCKVGWMCSRGRRLMAGWADGTDHRRGHPDGDPPAPDQSEPPSRATGRSPASEPLSRVRPSRRRQRRMVSAASDPTARRRAPDKTLRQGSEERGWEPRRGAHAPGCGCRVIGGCCPIARRGRRLKSSVQFNLVGADRARALAEGGQSVDFGGVVDRSPPFEAVPTNHPGEGLGAGGVDGGSSGR